VVGGHELESLYSEAQAAFKAKEYMHASELLQKILAEDENYKDASRLLAQAVRLKRRRWYNDLRIWGAITGIILVGLLIWFASRIPWGALFSPPTITASPTQTTLPTHTSTPLPLAWKRINIGQEFSRDAISAIVVDPKDAEIIYVGTQNAGVFKSIDGGITWKPIQSGMGGGRIGGLAIDPKDTQILYAAIISGGTYKSNNGGQSWFLLHQDFFYSSHKIAVAPWDSQVLFEWGQNGIQRSDDGGLTFEPIASDDCLGRTRGGLFVSHTQPGTLFISALIDPYDSTRTTCEGGIYRSQDYGLTWELIGLRGYYLLGGAEEAFAVGGTENNYMYATTSTKSYTEMDGIPGLYMSPDGGATWKQVRTVCSTILTNPYDGKEVYCFNRGWDFPEVSYDAGDKWNALLPTETSTFQSISLYRSGNHVLLGGNGLYESLDNGETWNALASGLGARRLELKYNVLGSEKLFLQEAVCDTPGGRGLYRSTDNGYNWSLVSNHDCDLAFDADQVTLYRGNSISRDLGVTWERKNLPRDDIQSIVANPTRSGVLFSITDFGSRSYLFRSYDHGDTWEELPEIQNMGGAYPRLFTAFADNTLYLTANFVMFASTDDGGTWKICGEVGSIFVGLSDQVLAVDPRDSMHLIAATSNEGIQISNDGCQSWHAGSLGTDSISINSVVIDPNQPDTLYAGTDGGAYVSFDAGENWHQINDGLLGATVVYSVAVDKDSNVYAATPYGIFTLESNP
jgi:photosystem II stability/assembly factor-like uncharacterized protein